MVELQTQSLPNSTQRFGFYSNVAGQLVLRNALQEVGTRFEYLFILLFWGMGEERGNSLVLFSKSFFHYHSGDGLESGEILKKVLCLVFIPDDEGTILCTDPVKVRLLLKKQTRSSNDPLVFGKEIGGFFFAICNHVFSDTAFGHKVTICRNLALFT